jgi:hypothetical protein
MSPTNAKVRSRGPGRAASAASCTSPLCPTATNHLKLSAQATVYLKEHPFKRLRIGTRCNSWSKSNTRFKSFERGSKSFHWPLALIQENSAAPRWGHPIELETRHILRSISPAGNGMGQSKMLRRRRRRSSFSRRSTTPGWAPLAIGAAALLGLMLFFMRQADVLAPPQQEISVAVPDAFTATR